MDKIIPSFDRSEQILNAPKTIHFQSLTWLDKDFENRDIEDQNVYEIYASGVTLAGESITVRIRNFNPYFYILVPDTWKDSDAKNLFLCAKKKLGQQGYALVKYSIKKRKKLFPYLAERKFKFVKLSFSTDAAFTRCKYMFSKGSQEKFPIKIPGITNIKYYEAFETNIKHLNRFCHSLDIQTTGWLFISNYTHERYFGPDSIVNETYSQINISVDYRNIKGDPNTTAIAPISILSWDIECLPENTEEFPRPEVDGDVIKQISAVLNKYGTSDTQSFIFTSNKCSEIKICACGKATHIDTCSVCGPLKDSVYAVVVEATSEKGLLENFCEFIKIVDPDIVTGFNTWGFDDNYFWKRAVLHSVDVSRLSRIRDVDPTLTKKELSSSAYGNNEFNYVYFPGRETLDMLVSIRREHNLESNSLDSVSKHFLKESKNDLSYRIMFEKLKSGGPDEIAECAVYCIQDSNLTVRLLLKLNLIPNYIEMARTTYVPIDWLLFRGQQCKVFSLIAKLADAHKYIIPVYERVELAEKFKGATVMDPMVGLHYDPIAGLDFASLYPSIMMAYNMCYTTYIETEQMMKHVIENEIPYKTIEWKTCECKRVCEHPKQSHSFVQIEDDAGKELSGGIRGILGIILMTLMKGRKETKARMKHEKDLFMNAVLNGKQLAQKVTMNSVYGFTGADNGILPLKAIASSVTATGRMMIDKTSAMAGEQFGAITIYGDSIHPDELITVNGTDVKVEEFANKCAMEWKEYRGFKVGDTEIKNKEYKDVHDANLYTLTHNGHKPINKIIRHTTKKKMYKIEARDLLGNIRSVMVTEGHSLIDDAGNLIVAENLKVGDKLWEL